MGRWPPRHLFVLVLICPALVAFLPPHGNQFASAGVHLARQSASPRTSLLQHTMRSSENAEDEECLVDTQSALDAVQQTATKNIVEGAWKGHNPTAIAAAKIKNAAL